MTIRYPLKESEMRRAFAALKPDSVSVTRRHGLNEGCVDGEWSLRRLRGHFRSIGFKPVGSPGALLFVNAEETVGLQCMGVRPHPTKNTWMTYYVEVQARSQKTKDGKGIHAAGRLLW